MTCFGSLIAGAALATAAEARETSFRSSDTRPDGEPPGAAVNVMGDMRTHSGRLHSFPENNDEYRFAR